MGCEEMSFEMRSLQKLLTNDLKMNPFQLRGRNIYHFLKDIIIKIIDYSFCVMASENSLQDLNPIYQEFFVGILNTSANLV